MSENLTAGVMECWSVGMLEKDLQNLLVSITPILHYSITPLSILI
jgi:hypothetical protein